MTLELTEAAVEDLKSIREYTLVTWGEEQEERYLNGIWAKFEALMADPGRFRTRGDLFPGCRFAVYEKHVILFRVEGDTLQIVRVLHGAMDPKRQLEG